MIELNAAEYRDKVVGCWLGKNIGGTIGAPFEWKRQLNNVSFYTHNLNGEPLPNDDLDLQLLWLIALEEKGPLIDAHRLAEYWLIYITPHWAEYGTSKANLRMGIAPPLSGIYNNAFRHSCGSFIRTEIWACLAPGDPKLAARLALQDSIVDHGDGEGTYAAIFAAAMEAAAFVENDLTKLVDIGLSYIPDDCGVAKAIHSVRQWHKEGKTWQEARQLVLEHYRGKAPWFTSHNPTPEEVKKGFMEGPFAWDVPSNIGILLIGMLWGAGDFGETQCICVNCGEDTDCTAATAGSLFGIMYGAKNIPEKWIKPIGHNIKTICLNHGELGGQIAPNVDNLTDRVIKMQPRIADAHRTNVKVSDKPTNLTDIKPTTLFAGEFRESLLANANKPVFKSDWFTVILDYGPDGPELRGAAPKTIGIEIHNTYKVQTPLMVRCYTQGGLSVGPASEGAFLSLPAAFGPPLKLSLTFTAAQAAGAIYRATLELTMPGRSAVMHVPITLINAALR